MNKILLTFIVLEVACAGVGAQTVTKTSIAMQWNNYSTSFSIENGDTTPFIVTAIPYNGKYNVGGENAPFDVSFTGSEFRYQSALHNNYHSLSTYDSSDVYFFVPTIHPANAAAYEYRVLVNDKTEIKPWSSIEEFTPDTLQLYTFKKVFGALGGYKTTWKNFITVQLRKKGTTTLLTAATVYWKPTKPALYNIYTSNELNEFLIQLKNSYRLNLSQEAIKKWQKEYPASEIDSTTHLPKKLVLQATDNNIIFYLRADIYKKEALEYQLVQDGNVVVDWKPNDFDNNVVWLKNLSPGKYTLRMRFSAQRHNVTEYPFEIKPAWHQTTFFKIIAGSLIAAFFGFIILAFRLARQKQKTAEEQSKKAKLSLELKAIHSQLNPHFVFNALNSIQGLINKNDIAGANRYLSDFGKLMRDSLTGSDKDFVSLDKEINMLQTYLALEQLRFGFAYMIHADKAINTSETDIPVLLLQPLVENAVKHGVSPLEEKGVIHIDFVKENNDMLVTIQDNGNGFITNQSYSGYGLKLTKDRVTLLNEVLKGQSIIFNISSNTASGVIVHILFKNWWL